MADMTPQEANAAGVGWVPRDHPNYGKQGYVGYVNPGTTPQENPGSQAPQPNGQLKPSPIPQIGTPQGPTTSAYTPGTPVTGGPLQASPTGKDPNAQLQDVLRSTLISQLNANPNTAAITDPDLAPQSQAYSAARTQQRDEQRMAQAELLSAQGLGASGAKDAATSSEFENAGRDIASYNAGLVGQKLDARRQQVQQALDMALRLGMTQEANALQVQLANLQAAVTGRGQDVQLQIANMDANTRQSLANLDAQLQREGYSVQERIARMDSEMRRYGIDVQGALGRGQLSLDQLRLMLQNQQFNDQLGFDIGRYQSELNRDATIAGLRG